MSFAEMKKKRGDKLQNLLKETAKLNSPSGGQGDDDRFWRPELDKSGNGMAVIRFLPAPDGEDLPWARTWNHGFQGPGGWYIENSLTTLSQKDPVSEHNSQLWNSGVEANKDIARKQKRRLTYMANVYVVSDPVNPQNEGQVRLYKFGKKIWDKVNDKMNPEFADETPVNPFDLWEGANFKIKIRKIDGFSNYDKSEFATPGPLDEDETKMEDIWKTEYSLVEFTDPKNFKSYTELKEKLDRVLGLQTQPSVETSPPPFDGGKPYIATVPKMDVVSPSIPDTAATAESSEELSYFADLATAS
jgi:hypothetical protein